MQSIQTIVIEPALKPTTIATIEAVNLRIVAHNESVEKHRADCEKLKGASLDAVDGSQIFNPKNAAARKAASFDLAANELAIRRDLVPIFEARHADRLAYAEKLEAAIEPAREALVAKLHRLQFVGDGITFDATVPGSIWPYSVSAHPSVKSARDAAVDARAVLGATGEAQTNFRHIEALENELRGKLAAAA